MNKLRIFISSVQSEFARERQMLYEYISKDALLGRFFEPFIFEYLPASGKKAQRAWLEQVERCDIYLGLFGKQYGFNLVDEISPTEREFDHARTHNKTRLIFLINTERHDRETKMQRLILKAENEVVRKKFSSPEELKTAVYAALVNYMEEKEIIRTVPFDAALCKGATLDNIDPERIRWFIELAREKRNFPLTKSATPEEILTHLNLLRPEGLTSAAILLFGLQPQRFFITAEVRCALFPGYVVEKPITSYQVYKGSVFQQVDAAVEFVLSRINLYIGDRSQSIDVPTRYELPPASVKEAIVNAIAHRDYSSNASVQVMLFRNRLEVWNPGQLPYHLSISKLKQPHASYPANPLLAEPLYLAGYIERMGTGIPDMVKECLEAGLKEPELKQDEAFKTILWRAETNTKQVARQDTLEVTPQENMQDAMQDTMQVTMQVEHLLEKLEGVMSREELQEKLVINNRDYFRRAYIIKALKAGLIAMTIPNKPNSKNQKYHLTEKGKALQSQLRKIKNHR
ncbi:MAG TPA: DUF4062 domain-containing protein [Bacteroidales bacterium]|nr:DUF4062 domain-containing protein [Bacteroidales bacterium]